MSDYTIRLATDRDADALVHHRIAMFSEMGTKMDAEAVARAFRSWLAHAIPSQTFTAWIVEADGAAVAGGGVVILPWPPGPRSLDDRLPFVFNVYVEPAHRRRGVAHRLMDTIHRWCRGQGLHAIGLAASQFGLPLYQSMGYAVASNPYMFKGLAD